MNALIIVDVQNDFAPGRPLGVPEGDLIVPLINLLQSHFDLVVATQDWHPADHASFAANHTGRRVGDTIDLNRVRQILWPVQCVQGTVGAEFVPELQRETWKAEFQKGTDPQIDSYSGFFDNSHTRATGLAEYLQANRVTHVYLAGLATDYCVKFTALDALELGFQTYLIADACRGVNLQHGDVDAALETMRSRGVTILSSTEITSKHPSL